MAVLLLLDNEKDSNDSIPLLLPAWAGYQIAGLGGRGPGLLSGLVRSLEEECIFEVGDNTRQEEYFGK